ncbi:Glycosyl transferase family 8 [Trinorchestia longiramus]|nr:Glycosyl transferase family 8 [Trinorchestia longiramus]
MKLSIRRSFALCLLICLLLILLLVLNGSSWQSRYSTVLEIDLIESEALTITTSSLNPGPTHGLPKPLQHPHIVLAQNSSAAPLLATNKASLQRMKNQQSLVLCIVCCGKDRLNESQTALKSAVIFSSSPLQLIVFTELMLFNAFIQMRTNWPAATQARVTLSLQEVRYPASVQEKVWRPLFKDCASLRLFLPTLLPDTTEIAYVDTDVVFVSPLEAVWHHFLLMNKTQLAAVTPEHQDSAAGWYNRFAKHPYYGKLGVNSGVMLMHLTRMRRFGWEDYVVPLREQYKQHIRWGDQDLINILFHFHPELVYMLDCSYNYRPDHCMYGSVCGPALKTGAKIIHASRRAAFTEKFPPFRDVYNAVAEFSPSLPCHKEFLGKNDYPLGVSSGESS